MSTGTKVPASQNQGASQNTRNIVTILFLIFLYPVGIIIMWAWSKWKATWLKVLLTLFTPLPLIVFVIFIGAFLSAVNPAGQIQKAECAKECSVSADVDSCLSECMGYNTTVQGSLPEEFRTSYIDSCIKNGGSETYCNCTLTYLESNLTTGELSNITVWTNPTSNAYKVLSKAIQYCR